MNWINLIGKVCGNIVECLLLLLLVLISIATAGIHLLCIFGSNSFMAGIIFICIFFCAAAGCSSIMIFYLRGTISFTCKLFFLLLDIVFLDILLSLSICFILFSFASQQISIIATSAFTFCLYVITIFFILKKKLYAAKNLFRKLMLINLVLLLTFIGIIWLFQQDISNKLFPIRCRCNEISSNSDKQLEHRH